jgi:hypothetical protein
LTSAPAWRRSYLPTLAILGLYLAWRVLLAAHVGWHDSAAAFDFEHNYWPAARHVLHGESPFPPVRADVLAAGTAFVNPAPAALLVAPFGLLSAHAAGAVFTALLFAGAMLALRLAGVRDRRCYLAVLLWWPVESAIETANLTLLLALGAALVWHYRDRPHGGLLAGAFIALKPLTWPLLIWFFATRRYAAGVWAVASTLVVTFGAWAVLGFAGLGDYFSTLRLLGKIQERHGYAPLVVALKLGVGLDAARAIGALLAVAVLGYAVFLAWSRRDDRRSFAVALAASVLWTPFVWLHYYALLIVALGLLRPRFGPLWLLPLLAVGPAAPDGPSWWAVAATPVMGVMLAAALSDRAWRGVSRSRETLPSHVEVS